MCIYLGIFLFLAIIISLLLACNRFRIIRKVRSMTESEKIGMLSSLIHPMGFSYIPDQDIFTSTLDSWQREYGYCHFYDEAAPFGNMVFNCEPVYFDYRDRTWMIELWKGQYGINTGAEIGVYHADRTVPPEEYSSALFQAVSDEEMPLLNLELFKENTLLFWNSARHWWLTGFRMGLFTDPRELYLKASITFRDIGMAAAFSEALGASDTRGCSFCSQGRTVMLHFDASETEQPCEIHPHICALSQWENRLYTRIFTKVTSPFTDTVDRLLYLYYCLPPIFRRTFRMRTDKRKKIRYRQKHTSDKKLHVKKLRLKGDHHEH